MNKIISANKGEWSEFYALVRLLSEGKVFGADENLKAIEKIVYPIYKIIRGEAKNQLTSYTINEENVSVMSQENLNPNIITRIKLREVANKILNSIQKSETGNFSVLNIGDIFDELNCKTVKASSQQKSDITLVIHDLHTGSMREVGFSIKSQLGGNPTLLNASDHTRITYEVIGINWATAEEANRISSKSKVLDRVKFIYEIGGQLKFSAFQSEIFRKNLRRIDTVLDRIIAELIKYSYIVNKRKIADIISDLNFYNLLQDLDLEKDDIDYKVKNLLWSSALGMTPGKIWSGQDEVYGGYLIVKESGEIVCYHLYNQDQFKDYLMKSVYFESPSSTRHKFGVFRQENGKIYFDLSLQIRFN